VIHTTLPHFHLLGRGGGGGGQEGEGRVALDCCYEAVFGQAAALGVKALAMPALGCGANSYPPVVAMDATLHACKRHIKLLSLLSHHQPIPPPLPPLQPTLQQLQSSDNPPNDCSVAVGDCVVDVVLLEPAAAAVWAQRMDTDEELKPTRIFP